MDILGKGWLVTGKPSALTCPKCSNAKVEFQLDAHLNIAHGIDFPNVGDQIDGCINKSGKLDIPWFTLDAASVEHDIPDHVRPGQRVALRVTQIMTAKPTDTVRSLFYRYVVTELGLQFVRTLPANRR